MDFSCIMNPLSALIRGPGAGNVFSGHFFEWTRCNEREHNKTQCIEIKDLYQLQIN